MTLVTDSGVLVDSHGRVHTDLRVSVTDRCNIRCQYCMPAEGVVFKPHDAILTFEEIERVVRVAASQGVRKVRLTGGEPLVRRGICQLVRMLARIPGIGDLAMTTNGVLLADFAEELKQAGLQRLNISLDTVCREKFREIARRDVLPRVLQGIAAARRAGFQHIKLNAVALRGQSEDDVVPLARFAREQGLELRFIEFMPLDGANRWQGASVLPAEEILRLLAEGIGPLEPIAESEVRGLATEYRFADGIGRVGVIASVSEPFCGQCGRIRLTAEGMIRNCLFSKQEWDLRGVLRGGGGDEQLIELFRAAIGAKRRARGGDDGQFARPSRAMYQIGG
jgi:cyclic pyranopterin phosphate synthase